MANTPYLLFTTQAAGTALTAGTAASMLVGAAPASGQLRNTIPAGWLSEAGTMIVAKAGGTVTTAGTPGTGTWSLYFGSTAIWNSNAITFTASSSTWPWLIELEIVVRAAGATTAATVYGQGVLHLPTSASAWTPTPFTPAAGVSGFDSTVPNVCDLWFTESLSTASLTCQWARVLLTNPLY